MTVACRWTRDRGWPSGRGWRWRAVGDAGGDRGRRALLLQGEGGGGDGGRVHGLGEGGGRGDVERDAGRARSGRAGRDRGRGGVGAAAALDARLRPVGVVGVVASLRVGTTRRSSLAPAIETSISLVAVVAVHHAGVVDLGRARVHLEHDDSHARPGDEVVDADRGLEAIAAGERVADVGWGMRAQALGIDGAVQGQRSVAVAHVEVRHPAVVDGRGPGEVGEVGGGAAPPPVLVAKVQATSAASGLPATSLTPEAPPLTVACRWTRDRGWPWVEGGGGRAVADARGDRARRSLLLQGEGGGGDGGRVHRLREGGRR